MPKNYKSREVIATGTEVFYYGPGGQERSAMHMDEIDASDTTWERRKRPVEIIMSRMGENDENVTDIMVRRTVPKLDTDGVSIGTETVTDPPLWRVVYDEAGIQTHMSPQEVDLALSSMKRHTLNTLHPNSTQQLAVKHDVVDHFVQAGLIADPLTAEQAAVPIPYVGAVNGDEHFMY